MKKFALLVLLFLAAAPVAAQLPIRAPFYGEWDCSQAPDEGGARTCLPHCGDINPLQWDIRPEISSCPPKSEEECLSDLFAEPPLCCPPGSTCNASRLLSRAAPCGDGHAETDGKCLPTGGDIPVTAEVCALFGGLTRRVPGGEICSGADADQTFCLLSSPSALPCRGLFNQARECNFTHGRSAKNPFLCGPKCPRGQQPRGGKCAPVLRVDWDHLRRHCPPRRHGDAERFPHQPPENGVYLADPRAVDAPPAGAICQLSRNRECYALDSAFAGLRPRQLIDDNGNPLNANSHLTAFPCDEMLDFCPPGQTDMDGNYFTEDDCAGEPSPHRVDLAHLEAYCRPAENATHPRQPEENALYESSRVSVLETAGKVCELSDNPYRYCYALAPDFVELRKRDLVDDNDLLLSEVGFPVPLCDNALALCPEGQTDADGDYFTEGDCVPAGGQ